MAFDLIRELSEQLTINELTKWTIANNVAQRSKFLRYMVVIDRL